MEPRRFYIHRSKDHTGISGTGRVAWGIMFPDGTSIIRWCTSHRSASTAIHDSLADLLDKHDHEGTEIIWMDS